MDIVIFRENTEDVYIGIEWKSGSPEAKKLLEFLNHDMLKDGKKQIRWDSGVGIKPISPTGTKRLVRRAIKFALANKRPSVTLVHKGNIQKFTEGGFRDWGYELAREEFRAHTITERESWIIDNLDKNPQLTVEQNAAHDRARPRPSHRRFQENDLRRSETNRGRHLRAPTEKASGRKRLLINDRIADSVFQQVLTARR